MEHNTHDAGEDVSNQISEQIDEQNPLPSTLSTDGSAMSRVLETMPPNADEGTRGKMR